MEHKNIRISREKETLARWIKAYKVAIEDYEGCAREMGIIDPAIDMESDSLHLKPHIKRLIRQISGSNTIQQMENQMSQLKQESAKTSHKYVIEIERFKSELSSAIIDREHAFSKLEKTERYNYLIHLGIEIAQLNWHQGVQMKVYLTN